MFKANPPNFDLVQDVDKFFSKSDKDVTDLSSLLGKKLPPRRKPKSKLGFDVITHELVTIFSQNNIKGVRFLFNSNDDVTIIDKRHGEANLKKIDGSWFFNDNGFLNEIGEDFEVAFWFKDQDNDSLRLCDSSFDPDEDADDAVDPILFRAKQRNEL